MFGPYRLDGLLGRGGMGEVHRAFDTGRGREVALKLLPESLSSDEDFRARFRREAQTTATLRDPHVIPIHDFGELDGRLYLDMRLVDGPDLATVLTRDRALPVDRAVTVVEQVAGALDAAHDDGLIHRDVKPSNILLSAVKPGRPDFCYLVDFGIARSVTSSTRSRLTITGATLGTLDYMAPERFLTGPIDHRVDVYALACVLHECLTGRRPFPSDELAVLVNSHLNLAPPRPSELRPGVPAGLDNVIARGMAKSPDDRFSSASDLATAARAALAPGSVAQPITVVVPTLASQTVVTPAAEHAVDQPAEPPRSRRSAIRWLIPAAALVAVATIATVATLAAVDRSEKIVEPPGTILASPNVPAPNGPAPSLPAPIVEQVFTGHTNKVESVATTELDGQPVAVSGDDDHMLRVWDLRTGQQVSGPLRGHSEAVPTVATIELDGRPVAVSGSQDDTLRIWDLRTGQQIGRPLTGHTDNVNAVATTYLDGRPVAVSGSSDRTLRIWDLHTGRQIGQSLTGHTRTVECIAITQLDGRPVAISADDDETLRLWDLRTGQQVGQPFIGHSGFVQAVATTELDGRPVAISGSSDDKTLRIWDLHTGEEIGQPLTGHTGGVFAVATAQLDGRPVAVSGGDEHTLRVWDLHTGQQIGQPLAGHTAHVDGIATTELDGRPVVVSASHDGTSRTWDLIARATR
jgi:WD40 repeat protein